MNFGGRRRLCSRLGLGKMRPLIVGEDGIESVRVCGMPTVKVTTSIAAAAPSGGCSETETDSNEVFSDMKNDDSTEQLKNILDVKFQLPEHWDFEEPGLTLEVQSFTWGRANRIDSFDSDDFDANLF